MQSSGARSAINKQRYDKAEKKHMFHAARVAAYEAELNFRATAAVPAAGTRPAEQGTAAQGEGDAAADLPGVVVDVE